jgi:hypothetical protein
MSPCGAIRERCYGFPMDPVEKATFERLGAIYHLRESFGIPDSDGW